MGYDEVVKFLLAHGANADIKDQRGFTALDAAEGKPADSDSAAAPQTRTRRRRRSSAPRWAGNVDLQTGSVHLEVDHRLSGLLSVVLSLAASPLSAALSDDPDARLLRVERWLKAAFSHQPGANDDAVTEVSLWSDAELRTLYADQAGLAKLIQDPSRRSVKIPAFPGRKPPPEYTDWQVQRLHVLACAANGALNDRLCAELGAERQLDPTLKRLAKAAASAAARGEPNFIVKRGALLHGDIAMAGLPPVLAPDNSGELGKIKIEVNDGESRGYNPGTVHWEMARQLFDYVRPDDPLTRQWYVATAAWMQDREQHDTTTSSTRGPCSRTRPTSSS